MRGQKMAQCKVLDPIAAIDEGSEHCSYYYYLNLNSWYWIL